MTDSNASGINEKFGHTLKEILNARSVTQRELASDVGISASRLNNYINGKNFPSIEVLAAIADRLEVTVDYLLGRNHASVKNYKAANVVPLLDFYERANVENGDVHISNVPVYKSVSDPAKLFNPAAFESVITRTACPSGYNEDQDSYALLISDDSMAPFFLCGDVVYIESCAISLPKAEQIGFDEVFAVRLSERDKVGITLRKIILRSNICVLVPINPEYPTNTIYLDGSGFNPIAGRPAAILRNLRDYKNNLTDILKR